MKYLILDKRPRVEIKDNKSFPTADSRIMEELDKKNIPYDLVYNDQIEYFYSSGETKIIFNNHDIKEYSHIILRGHNLHKPREYEMKRIIIDWTDQYNLTHPDCKILVQNSEAIKKMPYYNKIYTAQICSTYNIPYFDSYYSTDGNYTKEREILNNYPLVIKEYAGVNRLDKKWGKEVIKKNIFKLNNLKELNQKHLKKQDLKDFFIQEFSPTGIDIRLFVRLGKVIGGFKREASSGFMTISNGKYKIYNTPTIEEDHLARKIAEIFDADFIAVDIMYKDDKPYLQEIGFHPGFKAYETKTTDGNPINIADAIITAFRD